MLKPIAIATALCGALDILFAMILTAFYGREIGKMLRGVAAGPFPNATDWGAGGAVLGLLVHFTLMAIMATVFMVVVRSRPTLLNAPLVTGIVYGLITYVVMNLVVIPLRFPTAWPPKTSFVITQLFAHLVLVGIPMALIAARSFRPTATA